jgi:hypothetical protein
MPANTSKAAVLRHMSKGCRMQFVPQIVNGLMKLGLHNQASPENRKLSLDLAGLIIYWEQRRLAESRARDAAPEPQVCC